MEISMLINIFKMIKAIDEADLSIEGLAKLKRQLLILLNDDLENQDELYLEFIKNRDLDFKKRRIDEELTLAFTNSVIEYEKQKNKINLDFEEIEKRMNEILQATAEMEKEFKDEK